MNDTKKHTAIPGSEGAGKPPEKKQRKQTERIPRTAEEVAFSKINNVLKRLPEEMRSRVMKSVTALCGNG